MLQQAGWWHRNVDAGALRKYHADKQRQRKKLAGP